MATALSQAVLSIPAFHTSAPFILDADNRARIFHGTNFVQKGWPWYPPILTEEKNIIDLASLGVNTIRLGFMWTGAEPVQGQFNQTYFDIMGGIVDTLHKHGITPLLDVHQDVMSTYFCLYDGFPTWAVDLSAPPAHAMPWPLQPDETGNICPWTRGWAANYFSEACSTAFQSLYSDGALRDAFSAFWTKTASYFKDKPILGYEILNEPWAGNIYSDPALLLPGHAGRANLQPFYEVISSAIRSQDPDRLIFFEPVTWGMIFNGEVLGSGLEYTPGHRPDASVFSYHYYCWWYKDEQASRETCDRKFGPKVMEAVQRDIRNIGGAAMLTEWGQGCNFDAEGEASNAQSECNAIMDLAERHQMGWMDWYFGGWLNEHNWNMSVSARQLFSRTYARAIAGTPVHTDFDVVSKEYKACWKVNADVQNDLTEIFASFSVTYPHGVDVHVTPNLDLVVVDTQRNLVLLRNRLSSDQMACATITAKTA